MGQTNEYEIRELAYALWLDAGQPPGSENHFWLEAERRLTHVEPSYPTAREIRQAWPSEQTHGLLSLRLALDRLFELAASMADIPRVNENVDLPKHGILWHYTSGDALIGIIQSNSVWATQLEYLNDNSEYRHPFKHLAEVLELKPINMSS